ncbi:DNA repair protein RAD51 homolog 1-like isoform X3 [Cotesia glomerata]|uniref:DNA repair protein RAD51 homolog 1-like isoform X3 n=1 Tax=Cotesia glomerata TaxID=32391 RepID=UPI001D01B13C|nr:DNA repair protein RAD51 homolog 1-like isoform X3 [Cotesia glomerata]
MVIFLWKISIIRQAELEYQKLSSSSKLLDKILDGGFQCGTITELCGAQGSGKTQICFQACLHVQLSRELGGLNGRALYIDTRNAFSLQRINDLIEGYKKLYPRLKISNDLMAQNIQIATLGKLEELSTTIEKLKNTLVNQTKNNLIRLIIIDSLSFLIMSVEEPSLRVRLYLNILDELQKLASKYNIAVIVVNELVTQINLKGKIIFDSAGGQSVSSRFFKRLQLTRTASSKFAVKLLKSSIMEQITVPFSIDTDGIRDLV